MLEKHIGMCSIKNQKRKNDTSLPNDGVKTFALASSTLSCAMRMLAHDRA